LIVLILLKILNTMKNIAKISILVCALALAAPAVRAQVDVGVSISAGIAPPALPVYVQPACPVDGYLWQPGYWAYDPEDGYYWVPGTWVAPPQTGYLWTPPYWGFGGGVYGFHGGYWGASVGFYGGINYGFGFGGIGFVGGMWSGGAFRYNTAVMNVNRTVIHNTYINRTVINNNRGGRYSFNGPGGSAARPNAAEERAMNEHHISPTASQVAHQQAAHANRGQFANVNHGHPTALAMNKVGGRAYTSSGHAAPASAFNPHASGAPKNVAKVEHNNTAAQHTAQRTHQAAARTEATHQAAARTEATHQAAARTEATHQAAQRTQATHQAEQRSQQQATQRAHQQTAQHSQQQAAQRPQQQHTQMPRAQAAHPAPAQKKRGR
jgi:hypothetical protein